MADRVPTVEDIIRDCELKGDHPNLTGTEEEADQRSIYRSIGRRLAAALRASPEPSCDCYTVAAGSPQDRKALRDHLDRFAAFAATKTQECAPGGCVHMHADSLRTLLAESFDTGAHSMREALGSLKVPASLPPEAPCDGCGREGEARLHAPSGILLCPDCSPLARWEVDAILRDAGIDPVEATRRIMAKVHATPPADSGVLAWDRATSAAPAPKEKPPVPAGGPVKGTSLPGEVVAPLGVPGLPSGGPPPSAADPAWLHRETGSAGGNFRAPSAAPEPDLCTACGDFHIDKPCAPSAAPKEKP